MPFYRIKFRRILTFYSTDITICFKSSDRHSYDFFYLICLCFDNIHPTSPYIIIFLNCTLKNDFKDFAAC